MQLQPEKQTHREPEEPPHCRPEPTHRPPLLLRRSSHRLGSAAEVRRPRLYRHRAATPAAGLLLLLSLATGCHHRHRQAYVPPAPAIHSRSSNQRSQSSNRRSDYSSQRSPSSNQRSEPSLSTAPRGPIPEPTGKPTFVETGMASWYGPSGHRTADGSSYDGTGMTAAHKTLALGTVARVTNLSNGESVVVRITDRGPFSHGRILDLSESAAKQIDLYRMGVAKVKIEVFANPAASPSGRWCVQTGAFKSERAAIDLKKALIRRYAGARVTEFAGATGYWVRIDPALHDHADANAILDWIGKPDAQAVPYLVRID